MSEHPAEEHSSLIKTPKQLIIVVVLAFLVPVVLIGIYVIRGAFGFAGQRLALTQRGARLHPSSHQRAALARPCLARLGPCGGALLQAVIRPDAQSAARLVDCGGHGRDREIAVTPSGRGANPAHISTKVSHALK